jgi:hypothetical protein
MLAFFICGAVLVLLIGLLLVIKIRVDIRIILVVDENQRILDIEILPWGSEKWRQQYRLQMPSQAIISLILDNFFLKKKQYQLPGWFGRLSTAEKINSWLRLGPILSRAVRAVHIKTLHWRSIYGGEDAMVTALRTGSLWAAKGILISIVSSVCRLENMQIEVEPDFHQQRVWSRFSGIFQMRLVHIILVGAHIIVWMVRGYLNGRTAARRKSAQSSHRGINENCYAEY